MRTGRQASIASRCRGSTPSRDEERGGFQAGAGGADADLVVCGMSASTAGFLKEEHRPGKTRARGRSDESSHAGGWGASWAIANWYPSVCSGAYECLNATEGALAHPHTDNKCHSVNVSRARVVSR